MWVEGAHCLIQCCLEDSSEVPRELVRRGCERLWDSRALNWTFTPVTPTSRSVPTTLTSHVGTPAQYPPPSPPMWGPPLSTHHPHLPCGDPRSVPTTLTSHVGTLAQYPPPSPPKWGPPLSTHHPHLPSGDPLSKLLIDHDSNGEDVGSSGLGRVKGRPEQLLQVLAELKELHLEDWEAEDRAGTNTHMYECISTSVCMCLCTFVPCDEIDVCVMHCEVTAYPWGSSSL